MSNEPTALEKLLGPNLLTKVGATQPTATAFKDKELVGLYFSASWCPPCRTFTPVFSEFYKACAKEGKLEVVYVSSDRDIPSFNEYYSKMPWLAIPSETGSAQIKNNLAQALQIRGIPSLVILDAKTGNFVTDGARNEVADVGGDKEKGKELIASWKAKEAVPLDQAEFGSGQQSSMIMKIISYFMKNPLMLVGLYYLVRKFLRRLQEEGQEEIQEQGQENKEL